MIQVGDQLKGITPRDYVELEEPKRKPSPMRPHRPLGNRVEYIHPKGRFATIRFFYAFGSFCESRSLYRGELT